MTVRKPEPRIKESFPPVEEVLELEPEELASYLLMYLKALEDAGQRINRHNFTLINSPEFEDYASEHKEELRKRFIEAWIWLEKELLVAPKNWGEEFFVTRRGVVVAERIAKEQNFEFYKAESLLPAENLDPALVREVRSLFIRGDYDTAVFKAFREVEIRVREKAGYTTNEIGVALMRNAFHPDTGSLVDSSMEKGERQAISDLFAGAIGKFKNPSSHRNVEYTDPKEVADIIHIANQLLRMCR